MRRSTYVTLGIGLVLALLAASSIEIFAGTDTTESAEAAGPGTVEHVKGSELGRVTLTALGAKRIGLQTGSVAGTKVAGNTRATVPYSALLYDGEGRTWVYTSTKPLTFVRAPVKVASIDGERVVLREGTKPGTRIATVGVAELYGTEFEISH